MLDVIIMSFIRDFLSFFQAKNNSTVDGIDFYITDVFGEGLFNSCKDVKFGTMNTRAIDFIGAGAHNFEGEFALDHGFSFFICLSHLFSSPICYFWLCKALKYVNKP